MSASTLEIRRADVADAETVMTMVLEIAAHEEQLQHVTVSTDRWRAVLKRDDVIVLLAERRGEAVGYVSCIRRLHLWSDRDVLALDDLYVREGERDGGVGRRLMVALAEYATPERLTITWGVEPENEAAQRFYRRLGAKLRPKVLAGWAPCGSVAHPEAVRLPDRPHVQS
ncbi:MAG TPA: GNAT family N-acetyltransferase [Actinomycetales bacterium]|nr:GNAT family N-acetyltransferase [Actinomycetales bacterium]